MVSIQNSKYSKVTMKPDQDQCRFFYVGSNVSNTSKFVRLLQYGFITDNIKDAKAELRKCLQNGKSFPEIIFCESHFGFSTIKKFCLFLQKHKGFAQVPVVIDAAGLRAAEVDLYKYDRLADDVSLLEETPDDSILLKIQFLKKLKSMEPENESTIMKHLESVDTMLEQVNIDLTLKRSFDILVSLIALVVLSPLFVLIALAIFIETPGPVLYVSKRAGRGYRIFNFYKFRTMFIGADKLINDFNHCNQYSSCHPEGPAFFKIEEDPRVTRVGTFLRNTSLDELPQLINVLLGDMSVVGNRPLPLYEAATLTTDEFAKRFLAPAGMTGLWQVKKRGKKEMSAEERINLDIHYAKKSGFMYDLWIMANTPSALIQKSNA